MNINNRKSYHHNNSILVNIRKINKESDKLTVKSLIQKIKCSSFFCNRTHTSFKYYYLACSLSDMVFKTIIKDVVNTQ